MPSRKNTSIRRVEPRVRMSCQTLVSCASSPEANDTETLARSSIPSYPATFAVRAATGGDVPEAEAQDVDVVDGVLNEAAAPGLAYVRTPLRGIRALNGEVLVVTEHGGHRRSQFARRDQAAERAEDGCAAQHQPALARNPGGVDRLHEGRRWGRSTASGFSQNTARSAATHSSTAWR